MKIPPLPALFSRLKNKNKSHAFPRDKEICSLIKGYEKFRARHYDQSVLDTRFKRLAREGQSPKIMVISCCDSRVDPSITFHCEPGELFVVRNVANLVPPCDPSPHHHSTSSALEFAVQNLLVKHIIVLGHSQCGGIRALLETPDHTFQEEHPASFIFNWMQIAKDAKKKVLAEYPEAPFSKQEQICDEEALRISLGNLKTFPWIEEKVRQGELSLHAWRFDLTSGHIYELSPETNEFEDIYPLASSN